MNPEKHVLILSSWYPTRLKPFLGNFVERYAKLISKKFKVTVLHVVVDESIENETFQEIQSGNLREIIIYIPKSQNRIIALYRKYVAFKNGLSRVQQVDIVHGNICFPNGWQFILAKKKFHCPLVLSEYGSIFREEQRVKFSFFNRFLLKKLKKHAQVVTAVSDILIEDMQFDFQKEKIRILPCIVNDEIFYPNHKENIEKQTNFLHISTLDEKFKNPKGIMDACAILAPRNKGKFKMTIVSDEDFDKWQRYSKEQNLDAFIDFIGPLNESELSKYYNNSDAFVLFSNYESFSIVTAEAWSCGIPVIATNVGIAMSMPDFLGVNVRSNDLNSLANEMEKFILNKKQFDSKAISSFAKGKFSQEKVLSLADEIYKNL